MSDALSICCAKFDRAEKHRAELHRAITKFRNGRPYRIRSTDDPNTRETVHEIRNVKPIPSTWQPILGDCLHNYRCSLDHLVWALVCQWGTQNEGRQFPVACSADRFNKTFLTYVGKTQGNGAKACFESLQPYKRANRPAQGPGWHPLWLLHRLDITDKHRQMLVSRLLPSFKWAITLPGFSIDHGAENVRVTIPFGPNGPMQVQPDISVNVAIAELDLGKAGARALGMARDLSLEQTIDSIGVATNAAITKLSRFCN